MHLDNKQHIALRLALSFQLNQLRMNYRGSVNKHVRSVESLLRDLGTYIDAYEGGELSGKKNLSVSLDALESVIASLDSTSFVAMEDMLGMIREFHGFDTLDINTFRTLMNLIQTEMDSAGLLNRASKLLPWNVKRSSEMGGSDA